MPQRLGEAVEAMEAEAAVQWGIDPGCRQRLPRASLTDR